VLPRFYVPDMGESTEPIVTLPEEEAAHLARVLRLAPGDAVRVFDGIGNEWQGEVASVTKKTATVRLAERVETARESLTSITLAMAVLKSDKMDDVVRDAVMLGVSEIVPLITARTEVSRATVVRGGRVERWQRIAVASAKQCGRAVVPTIGDVVTFDQWIAQPRQDPVIILVEPSLDAKQTQLPQILIPSYVLIGPEGGWTEAEVNAAVTAGATPLTLGSFTLRADAAPIVALTAIRTVFGDM
jgi:16S rRNA (uracil1498-N3)-methyltransferase